MIRLQIDSIQIYPGAETKAVTVPSLEFLFHYIRMVVTKNQNELYWIVKNNY